MLFGSLQILIQILSHITLICVGVCLVYVVCSFLPFPFVKSVYTVETVLFWWKFFLCFSLYFLEIQGSRNIPCS